MRSDVFQGFQTILADQLALVVSYVVAVLAENAGRCVFLQDDLVGIDVDLQGILGTDVENAADLLGENDSAKRVYGSYDSCGFHMVYLAPGGALSVEVRGVFTLSNIRIPQETVFVNRKSE